MARKLVLFLFIATMMFPQAFAITASQAANDAATLQSHMTNCGGWITCQDQFTYNNQGTKNIYLPDIQATLTDVTTQQVTNIPLYVKIQHTEYVSRQIDDWQATTASNGTNVTTTYINTPKTISVPVIIDNPTNTLTPGVNIITVWTDKKPANSVLDWNLKYDVTVNIDGMDTTTTFDTRNKNWAVWSNGEDSNTFSYYTTIVINSTTTNNITNFPAYFRINTNGLIAAGKMNATCSDLRPVLNNNLLDYEIEGFGCNAAYNTTVWVRVPSMNSTGVVISVYYGKNGTIDKQNKTGVWSPANYLGVWHLSGDMKSSTGQYDLSTANACTNSTGTCPLFGRGYLCTGTNSGSDQRMTANITNLGSSTNITISVWGNVSATGGGAITQIKESSSYGHKMITYDGTAGKLYEYAGTGTSAPPVYENATHSLNQWGYVAQVQDKTNGNTQIITKTGLPGGTLYKNITSQAAWGPATDSFYVGAGFNGYGATTFFDEVRVANAGRSYDWLQAEAMQTYSMGTEQVNTLPVANESQGRDAILTGIATSTIGSAYTAVTDRQVYIRIANGTQYYGRFDVFAQSGSKRWAFNYDQNTTAGFPVFVNITPVFYVWQKANMTNTSITADVSAYINATS